MKRAFFVVVAAAVLLWAGTACAAERIGDERAKEIAFSHAGVSASSVTVTRFGIDWERGIEVYDIDFAADGARFAYVVATETGEIVKFERKQEPPMSGGGAGGGAGGGVGGGGAPARNSITPDRARDIALRHAGVSPGSVYKLKIELDREWGRTVYEIEFDSAGWEYDYDIDAVTGEVLRWNKEYD